MGGGGSFGIKDRQAKENIDRAISDLAEQLRNNPQARQEFAQAAQKQGYKLSKTDKALAAYVMIGLANGGLAAGGPPVDPNEAGPNDPTSRFLARILPLSYNPYVPGNQLQKVMRVFAPLAYDPSAPSWTALVQSDGSIVYRKSASAMEQANRRQIRAIEAAMKKDKRRQAYLKALDKYIDESKPDAPAPKDKPKRKRKKKSKVYT